jgi:hypothetical protein
MALLAGRDKGRFFFKYAATSIKTLYNRKFQKACVLSIKDLTGIKACEYHYARVAQHPAEWGTGRRVGNWKADRRRGSLNDRDD